MNTTTPRPETQLESITDETARPEFNVPIYARVECVCVFAWCTHDVSGSMHRIRTHEYREKNIWCLIKSRLQHTSEVKSKRNS